MPRALVVQDDPKRREAVTLVLERAGFSVGEAGGGAEALDSLGTAPWDLIILDVGLPDGDGFEVCQAIRSRSAAPIVAMGERAGPGEVVRAFERGADQYMATPFTPAELTARARAAVRRYQDPTPSRWTIRDLEIDEEAFTVSRDGTELGLSSTETRLLVALAGRAGQVVTREVLVERVWGYDHLGSSRLVDMAVLRLRAKLGEPEHPPPYIETVRSVGYRFARG